MEQPAPREAANDTWKEGPARNRLAPGSPSHIDVGRWREKVELRLDNRQVFFLFFGSAVVACMLFVLGVMVGKRIESRGQAEAPPMQDPLAALDRAHQPPVGVAAPESHELTFPSTLMGASKAAKPSAAHVAPPRAPSLVSAPKPAAPVAPVKPAAPAKPAAPKPVAVVAPKPAAPPADPAKVKGKFTLQIRTFDSADEANTFARTYPGAFVIPTETPGKGTTYRVRYGNFASFKEATAAKESFEKQHSMLALVAAR
jgi:hypothetical protein